MRVIIISSKYHTRRVLWRALAGRQAGVIVRYTPDDPFAPAGRGATPKAMKPGR